MAGPPFERVALIGIGLIGSSLARVLRQEMPQTRIVACARVAIDRDQRLGQPMLLDRPAERRPDQAEPDDRDPVEAHRPKNWLSASTTSFMSSPVPMVIRRAAGRP